MSSVRCAASHSSPFGKTIRSSSAICSANDGMRPRRTLTKTPDMARLEEADGDGDGVDDERQREQPQVAEAALANLAGAFRRCLRTNGGVVDGRHKCRLRATDAQYFCRAGKLTAKPAAVVNVSKLMWPAQAGAEQMLRKDPRAPIREIGGDGRTLKVILEQQKALVKLRHQALA